MDGLTPEDIQRLLASRQGQALGAGDYNTLRDLHQNLYNARAASQPGPWQASYYQQPQQDRTDIIHTGTGEPQKLPWDSRLQQLLPQYSRMFGAPTRQVGYGMMGSLPYAGGQAFAPDTAPEHIDMGSASVRPLMPDSPLGNYPQGPSLLGQAQARAAQMAGPARSMGDRMAALNTYAQAHNLDGLDARQLGMHVFGQDPVEYANSEEARAEKDRAYRLQAVAALDAHNKAAREASEAAVSVPLGLTGETFKKHPEWLISSAGYHDITDEGEPVGPDTHPSRIRRNVYSAYVPPQPSYDNMGNATGKTKGYYTEVPYGPTQAVIQGSQHYGQNPMDAAQAEFQQLHAQREAAMANAAGGDVADEMAGWNQTGGEATLPGIAARHSLGQFFSPGGTMDRHIANAGIGAFNQTADAGLWARNKGATALNFLYQLFGGNRNAVQPNMQMGPQPQPIQPGEAPGHGWSDPAWSLPR